MNIKWFVKKLKIKLSLKRWLKNRNIIGCEVQIGKGTNITGSILSGKVVIGNNCKIKEVEMDGDISIGNYTSLWGPNLDLQTSLNKIIIGNFCSIGRNVTFQEFNHDYSRFTTSFIEQNLLHSSLHKEEIASKGNIIVEHDVWIGAQCVILSGSHISIGAVIAANSVVSGYIPPYSIAAGSPAKVIKYRFSKEVIDELLTTCWWNWDEGRIKKHINVLKNLAAKQ